MTDRLRPPSQKGAHTRRILIAEEDETISEMIRLILAEEIRSMTAWAATADEALRLATNNSFDLILLSSTLALGNGFACYDRLRALPGYAQVPTLIMSTLPERQAVEIRKRHLPVIAKPFNVDELLAQVTQLLT